MGLLRVGIAALALLTTTCVVNAADALQVTALVGKDMKSTIECWTFTLDYLNVRGMKVQQLGDLSKATYVEMPTDKDFEQGLYTAPARQYFVILEGNVTITFPTSDEVLHVRPHKLYVATDTAETSELGHITVVRAGSRLMQFPFKNGIIPEHTATPGECGTAAQVTRDEL